MKRSCKRIDITDPKTVRPWVIDCVFRHWRRHDFRRLILRGGVTAQQYTYALRTNDRSSILPAIDWISEEACRIVRERDFDLPPVVIRDRRDHTTGKERQIGLESPMQQVLDYIAVHSCSEIWRRRIAPNQMSSIPGRGQILGVRMLRRFVRRDNRALAYARRHGLRYSRKARWRVKLDIRKCFPSSRMETFMRLFVRDCANRDIIWLWGALLRSHRVQGYKGFMIGSLVSQWAAQYLISFIWHHATAIRYRGRKAVGYMMMFMDDIALLGASRAAIRHAVTSIASYAERTLRYDVKGNWHVERMDRASLDMMGYVIHPSGKVTMRDRNYIHSRRLMLRIRRRGLPSYRQAVRLLCYKGFYRYSDSGRRASAALHCHEIFRLASVTVSAHDRRRHAA